MGKYTIKATGHNGSGDCCTYDVEAKSLRAAKAAATREAAGDRCHITIFDESGNVVAKRDALDTFRGCCLGWDKWRTAHHWTELIASDADGFSVPITETLNVDNDDYEWWVDQLEKIELDQTGGIESWAGINISLPDEEPDWDTPRAPIDWSGFREALVSSKHKLADMRDEETT